MSAIIKPRKGYHHGNRLSSSGSSGTSPVGHHTFEYRTGASPDSHLKTTTHLSSGSGGGIHHHNNHHSTMSHLPIFRDDLSFQDRNRRRFDDMCRRMETDMRSPFQHTWDDELDRLCGGFYQLSPSDSLGRRRHDGGGATTAAELLDEGSVKSAIVDDPVTKSRRFETSFDVKEYNPEDISVKVIDDSLIVEAKHEVEKEGVKTSSQFNRRVQIPKEVDSSKLNSTLSKDGILTISAPVPPQYHALTSPTASSADRASPRPQPETAKHVTSMYTTPGGAKIYTDISSSSPLQGRTGSPLLGRSSPLLQPQQPAGRASPLITQQTSSVVHQQQTAPAPPSYDQLNAPASPVQVVQGRPTPPLEEPTFYNTSRGRELVILIDIGKPYTPDDIKVKVDGLCISVEAEHVEKHGAKTSKCSVSRDFTISENIDAATVTANMKAGILEINALGKK